MMGVMKEHKDELAQLQRELSHLEKTYKTGIITEDEFRSGRNVLIKKINRVIARVKNEKASQEVIKDIISKKPSLESEKTRVKLKNKNKKVREIVSSKQADYLNAQETNTDENRVWQGVIYVLVVLLIISISFTAYRYYQVYGQDKIVTIYEFSDFQSQNARDVQETLRHIKDEYGGQVKIVFKHFPLEDAHPDALHLAEALECGAEQGQFVQFHNFLFNYQKQMSEEMLQDFVSGRDIDIEVFNNCLSNHLTLEKIRSDINKGKEKGVTAVPTFFIEDQMLVGNQKYEVFKYYIDQALK